MDPSNRITAEDALLHPYFTNEGKRAQETLAPAAALALATPTQAPSGSSSGLLEDTASTGADIHTISHHDSSAGGCDCKISTRDATDSRPQHAERLPEPCTSTGSNPGDSTSRMLFGDKLQLNALAATAAATGVDSTAAHVPSTGGAFIQR